MAANKYIFMSDLHIGTNYPTNWYQKSVHEEYLKGILQYIQSNASSIQDMVIVGDLFDFWMYPPSPEQDILPVDIDSIMDANPGVFTRQKDGSGDFISCMEAIRGNLYYLRGNHDMNFNGNASIEAMNKRFSSKKNVLPGYEIAEGCFAYLTEWIYASHGHSPYSPLCRPDPHDKRYGHIPISYFISRTAAQYSSRHFTCTAPNAAWLPHSGNPPSPYKLEDVLQWLFSRSLSQNILYPFVDMTAENLNYDQYMYRMPDGSRLSARQAAGLFDMPSGWNMETISWLMDNDIREKLHFDITDNVYASTARKLIIMGHTHIPALCYSKNGQNYLYANTGYLCPSIPDMQKGTPLTFVEVEIDGSNCIVIMQHVYKNAQGEIIITYDPAKDVLAI